MTDRARSRYHESLGTPVTATPRVEWRPGRCLREQAAMEQRSAPREIPKHSPSTSYVPGLVALSVLGARVIR